MGYSWVSTEARTGVIIADLPLLTVDSVKQSMGRYESVSGSLPLPEAPENWQRATMPGATHLILLKDNPNDPAHGIPLIGHMINRATPNEGDLLPLDMATVEGYMDRRYVGDKTYTQVGQNVIVADLINSYVLEGAGGKNGIPIRVQYSGPGILRDRTYLGSDDKTVLSVLTELSGVLGGPEWTIGWEWQHNPERITPVLYVGDRIGNPVTAGLRPAATFEIPGSVKSFSTPRDFSSDKGSTDVQAHSTAQGDVRPQSSHHVSVDPDRPTFEFRFSPSTSITDTTTLDAHAAAALANMKDGAFSIALSSIATEGPQLGVDFSLGDDVGFVIGGLGFDPRKHTVWDAFIDRFTDRFGAPVQVLTNINGRNLVPSYPGGIRGTARCMGWELTLGDTPILTPNLIDPVLEA